MAFTYDPMRAAYDFDFGQVNFYAADGDTPLRCGVSEEALMDDYGADSIDQHVLIGVFQRNSAAIASAAETKYLSGRVEPDGFILVRSGDR